MNQIRNHINVPTNADIGMQANELSMFIDNDYPIYQVKMHWFKNMWQKYKTGKFDPILARIGFAKLTKVAAKKYNDMFRGQYPNIGTAARKLIDHELVQEFMAAAKNKEYDFMR
jgi:hypothetical protein